MGIARPVPRGRDGNLARLVGNLGLLGSADAVVGRRWCEQFGPRGRRPAAAPAGDKGADERDDDDGESVAEYLG